MKKSSLRSRAVVAATAVVLASISVPALVAAAPATPMVRVSEHWDGSAGPVARVAREDAAAYDAAVKAEEARVAAEKAAAQKAAAEKAAAEAAARRSSRRATSRGSGSVRSVGTSSSGGGGGLAEAQSILAGLRARYPRYLGGVTVSFGDTRGYQAISYYTAGRIVIGASHTASLSRILNHEIWHIIDWRDNGRIDWHESVPPSNAADYR